MMLQRSVFSDSETTAGSGDPRVFWFRASSYTSYPDVIYTDGEKAENCNKTDFCRTCFYNFAKNINSSDAGTFYCAVATSGQVIFGNGTRLKHGMTLYTPLNVF